jgi:hypothetical protein
MASSSAQFSFCAFLMMNKKRKILTLVALAVFSLIIFLHYPHSFASNIDRWFFWHGLGEPFSFFDDVRMPLFVLGVFYAGLFAILGDSKRKEQ